TIAWVGPRGLHTAALDKGLHGLLGPGLQRGSNGTRLPVAFSADSRLVAATDPETRALTVWDVHAKKELFAHAPARTRSPPPPQPSLAFSPDGRMVATAGALDTSGAQLWETASGHLRRQFTRLAGPVTTLAFSGDGRFLASGGEDSSILIWAVYSAAR